MLEYFIPIFSIIGSGFLCLNTATNKNIDEINIKNQYSYLIIFILLISIEIYIYDIYKYFINPFYRIELVSNNENYLDNNKIINNIEKQINSQNILYNLVNLSNSNIIFLYNNTNNSDIFNYINTTINYIFNLKLVTWIKRKVANDEKQIAIIMYDKKNIHNNNLQLYMNLLNTEEKNNDFRILQKNTISSIINKNGENYLSIAGQVSNNNELLKIKNNIKQNISVLNNEYNINIYNESYNIQKFIIQNNINIFIFSVIIYFLIAIFLT